jgi:hypothetical protein
MTRAVLQYLDSADVAEPLDRYQPPVSEDFQLYVDAGIGADDREGADIFHFRVITPAAIQRLARTGGSLWLRKCLIVERYDYGVIYRAIDELCRQASGEDWQAVAAQIARYADWEFAEYDDYQPPNAATE